jgi:hypothetical protein
MNLNDDGTVTLTRAEAKNLYIAAARGDALQSLIATTVQLGHARPGNTLDYLAPAEPGSADAFVQDFTAWASGRIDMVPGCADRLREWGAVEARNRMRVVGALFASEVAS